MGGQHTGHRNAAGWCRHAPANRDERLGAARAGWKPRCATSAVAIAPVERLEGPSRPDQVGDRYLAVVEQQWQRTGAQIGLAALRALTPPDWGCQPMPPSPLPSSQLLSCVLDRQTVLSTAPAGPPTGRTASQQLREPLACPGACLQAFSSQGSSVQVRGGACGPTCVQPERPAAPSAHRRTAASRRSCDPLPSCLTYVTLTS